MKNKFFTREICVCEHLTQTRHAQRTCAEMRNNMSYDTLETAKAAMRFINTRKRQAEEGIYFSLEDGQTGHASYYDEICLYAGASGILCFLLGLYDVTGQREYLDEAKEVAKYLQYRWKNQRELKRNFSQYAFSSGWSGAGFALLQLYQVTGEKEYADTVTSIIEQAIRDAKPSGSGEGYEWSTFQGIVGNAGTVLFLLKAADILENDTFRDFAIEAGRTFLHQGRDMGDGKIVYQGVDPTYFGAGKDYIDPNFPMGTGGIAFTLLKLYEASKEKKFLDAVVGVTEYMDTVAVKMKAGKLLPHGLPDRGDLFYVGYCHGPAGTNRFFYQLYQMTGDEKYKKEIEDLTDGMEALGAPETRSAGYWNTLNICCGTAGILNMYLGLWAGLGEDRFYQKALECKKILSDQAVYEETEQGLTARWQFALDRVAPDVLTTPIGFLDGAAGIGAMLLQVYSAENGNFKAMRAIDDPFPASKRR